MRFEYYTSRTSCSTFEPRFILRETDIYLTNDMAHRSRFQFEYVSWCYFYRYNRPVYPWTSKTRIYLDLRFKTNTFANLRNQTLWLLSLLTSTRQKSKPFRFGRYCFENFIRAVTISNLHELHGILDELKQQNWNVPCTKLTSPVSQYTDLKNGLLQVRSALPASFVYHVQWIQRTLRQWEYQRLHTCKLTSMTSWRWADDARNM